MTAMLLVMDMLNDLVHENGGGAKPPRGWRNCGDFHFAFTSIGICLLG